VSEWIPVAGYYDYVNEVSRYFISENFLTGWTNIVFRKKSKMYNY